LSKRPKQPLRLTHGVLRSVVLRALLTNPGLTISALVALAIVAAFAFVDPPNASKDETEIGR